MLLHKFQAHLASIMPDNPLKLDWWAVLKNTTKTYNVAIPSGIWGGYENITILKMYNKCSEME